MNSSAAIEQLARHPGYSPVITWDGVGDFVVQADPKLIPIDPGHRVILTREGLGCWLNKSSHTATDDDIRIAAEWLDENKVAWFRDAEDAVD